MKHPFKSTLLAITALAICSLSTSSCAAFTKDDAKELGAYVAKESLEIAKAKLTGSDLDYKTELTNLGFDLAGKAIEKVAHNLTTQPSATPVPVLATAPDTHALAEQVVKSALAQATDQLSQQLNSDPDTTALAVEVATDSAAKALAALGSGPGTSL